MTHSVFAPGLESVTVAETELSRVDGQSGEFCVRGYPIEELAANATYEEVVYLLFHGRLPTETERAESRADLAGRRGVDDAVETVLRRAAREGCPPMDAVRMGVAAASLGADAEDPLAVAKRVVAVVPTVVATYWRYRDGDDPVAPDPELGHAANYLYMLRGERPTEAEVEGVETFLTTAVDHGLNPSTFTARTVVSTESDLVSAATAAVGTVKGPRHGGNLKAVDETLRAAHESGDPDAFVRQRVEADGELPGFGHRVYRVRDPRAAVMAAACERLSATDSEDLLLTARAVEAAGVEHLRERRPGRPIAATLEFYAVALLGGVGVPRDLLTATFAVSRVGGWMAHSLEQLEEAEVVRPVSRYVGETDRSWTPAGERASDGVGRSSLEPVSETLAVLAEPARLEILVALADADAPVAYSSLRSATTVDDKGRFNYHLRKLRGSFVTERGEGYTLTETGERLVETVLTDDRLLDTAFD